MMKVNITTILLICFGQFTDHVAQGMPTSPCPKIFQYRFDGYEWFGIVAIRNDDVQGLHIRVLLSMRGKPPTNYIGEIELLTRRLTRHSPVFYKIRFPKHIYPPNVVLISTHNQIVCIGSADLSIFMTQIQLEHSRKFSLMPDENSSSPIVSKQNVEYGMAVNMKPPSSNEFSHGPNIQLKKMHFSVPGEICGRINRSLDFRFPKQGKSKILDFRESLAEDYIFGTIHEMNRFPVSHSSDGLDKVEVNGKYSATNSYFVNEIKSNNSSSYLRRGAWPWLAAIYVNNITSLNFQCCGTLISNRVVISSAHCFEKFNRRYTANEVLVFLGRHNLKNWSEKGSLAAPVAEIFLHSDYNKQISDYDADIAVLILKEEVRFNTFIQPVCLWTGSGRAEYIVGQHGIIIGWAFNKINAIMLLESPPSLNAPLSGSEYISCSNPKFLKTLIVPNDVCYKSNAGFQNQRSNRTFCAKIIVDSSYQSQCESCSIYTGISGAGLITMKNNRWMLRGTVSAFLPDLAIRSKFKDLEPGCSSHYLIFSDVFKFIDWITAFTI